MAGRGNSQKEWKLSVRFGREEKGTAPVPIYQRVALGKSGSEGKDDWIEFDRQSASIKIGTKQEEWYVTKDNTFQYKMLSDGGLLTGIFLSTALFSYKQADVHKPEKDSPEVTAKGQKALENLRGTAVKSWFPKVFASAPVRSKPHRTYDPARPVHDPYGDYVPMLLAELSSQQPEVWNQLKQRLERFGQKAGLFDDICIQRFGNSNSNPFQVQVRKYGKYKSRTHKGPERNLIDVGYGVSQALPIITELLRDAVNHPKESEYPRPHQFLLQQPEVHLHPSAQAALGSLFCQLACPRRQLIVETHSDHLMDRVRMDVRDRERLIAQDGILRLHPEDVSILFFERCGLDVQIHSLRIDKEGNIVDAPDGYRKFFMEEMTRSLWPNRSTVEA